MSIWLDVKYLKQISYSLDRWIEKKTSPHLSICRCPICGDSQKKSNKKRGYFYEKGNKILYTCHNCGVNMGFSFFLKDFDPSLYKHYALESYKERVVFKEAPKEISPLLGSKKSAPKTPEPSTTVAPSILDDTTPITKLPSNHPARVYFDARKIPSKYESMFYFTEKFFYWASKNTDKFEAAESNSKDHPRIVIPWYNIDRELFAYQARSLNGEEPKYYTIILNPDVPKLFGMDRVDLSKKIYILEGGLDSMMIDNAVAVGSSALTTFPDKGLNVTYIWDCEPRNPDIVKLIGRAISQNKKVFIPPSGYYYKDLNDAVIHGFENKELEDLINENTFSGASALLRFNNWKRS